MIKRRLKMAKNSNVWSLVGSWAFVIGVILAILLGAINGYNGTTMESWDTWVLVLVIIGLVVGFLNISSKEVTPFLMSGAILIIASALGQSVFTGATMTVAILSSILAALLAIFVPATIIVAIKNVFVLARD
jgi:hypothetical protein